MDTPAFPRPRDHREQIILDHLLGLRDKLLLIKLDKTKHIQSQDVIPLYDELVDQVRKLNDIRPETGFGGETQLDRVLESCFQLISLAFMAIGRNNEAPAAFALTSTIRRLVDHLLEKEGLYAATDLERLAATLDRLDRIVKAEAAHITEGHACQKSPYVVTLLAARIKSLQTNVASLQRRLATLKGNLPEVHESLIAILREISLENTRSKVSVSEVTKLKDKVKEIDGQRVDGNFVVDGEIPEGNDHVCRLLNVTNEWADMVLENHGEMPEAFQETHASLIRIRDNLEKLSVTQTWSMRETDLYDYQRQLDRIDERRKNGQWIDEDGNEAPKYVQWTFGYLIRKSYVLIFILLLCSEPVSSALLPVFAQLQSLKRCLLEVKNAGGVESARELYPYMMKLEYIRKMKKNGKFMIGDEVPHGQPVLNELLNECNTMSQDLMRALK